MKETDKAVIQFLGYRVSEISYTCPVTLEFPSDAKISCNMNFSKALGRLMDSLKSTSTGILHGKPICWQYFFRI